MPAFYVLLNPIRLTSLASQPDTSFLPKKEECTISTLTPLQQRPDYCYLCSWHDYKMNLSSVQASKASFDHCTQHEACSFVSTNLQAGIKKDVICWVRGRQRGWDMWQESQHMWSASVRERAHQGVFTFWDNQTLDGWGWVQLTDLSSQHPRQRLCS